MPAAAKPPSSYSFYVGQLARLQTLTEKDSRISPQDWEKISKLIQDLTALLLKVPAVRQT